MTLRSVHDVTNDPRFPWSADQLRWKIRKPPAGFGECVIRESGRVWIDVDELIRYLDRQRLRPKGGQAA